MPFYKPAALLSISKQLNAKDLIEVVQHLEPLKVAAGEQHYLSCMLHQGAKMFRLWFILLGTLAVYASMHFGQS